MPRLTLCLEDWRLIGRKPKPRQAIQDLINRFPGRAFAVRILNTQQIFPAMMAREKPVKKRGAGPADMQIAGGGWCEACANSHGV